MSNKPDLSDITKSVESTRVARRFSADLKDINSLISWWAVNQNDISMNPDVSAKCTRIIKQLKNYRDVIQDMFEEYKRRAITFKSSKPELGSDEFKNAQRRFNEQQRKRGRVFDNAGHYFQAKVTRWFHEGDYFTITDVEVSSDNYDFDIEIADELGGRYCIEVWQGRSKLHHAMRENTVIMGVYNGEVHSHEGSVPQRLRDVASDHGAVSMNSKQDLPKVWKKLKQLPDDRIGFLVACRERGVFPPERSQSDFPVVPLDCIPDNKCIIVLNFGSDEESSKRGTAFVIHNPAFEAIEVAKQIIQSLEFKHDQKIYDEKVQFFEQFGLE